MLRRDHVYAEEDRHTRCVLVWTAQHSIPSTCYMLRKDVNEILLLMSPLKPTFTVFLSDYIRELTKGG